jgi:tetratricopeptide (TPR) repeat protein
VRRSIRISPLTRPPRVLIAALLATCSLLGAGCAGPERAPARNASQAEAPAAAAARVLPISTRSPEARALLEQAHALAGREQGAEAAEKATQALALDPDFAQAHALLAELGEGDAAASHRARARELAKGLPEAERLYIEVSIGDRAPEELARVAELAPDDARVLADLALFQVFRALDPAAARSTFEKLRTLTPEDASVHRHLAFLYAHGRQWPEALAAASAYVELLPGQPEPLDVKAEVLLGAGEFDQAEAAFRAALAIEPDYVSAYAGIASAKLYREDWDGALAEIDRAIAAAGQPGQREQMTALRGWTLLAAGRHAEARAALEQAAAARDASRGFSLLPVQLAIEREDWQAACAAAESTLASARQRGADDFVLRWLTLLHVVASSRAGDLAAAESGVAALEAGSAELPPWITKDLTFARGHISLARGDTQAAVAAFTDRWVLNHNSLFDPGRGNAQPALGQFAVQGKLLAAEALARGGRDDEAVRLLDELIRTYHRGIGAVTVQLRAKQARRALEHAGRTR